MEARATAKYIRVSSTKAKLVADMVRGKKLGDALKVLALTPNKAAKVIEKVVMSAAANAENNHEMDPAKLYIAEISANQGPTIKRYRARARGSASIIKKRTSHITAVLKEQE